ncbi:MAG: S8 family serine peptidase [Phycisphaeraceae bacterium]|nr:S8 family serine peptidase [Phycisphaerales bacterium]MCB9860310.1 S8 family serine peptidase [Phycisphaeraceae bacterium]
MDCTKTHARFVAALVAVSGAALGVIPTALAESTPTDPAIHLRTGDIDTSIAKSAAMLAQHAGVHTLGKHYVIQLDGPMNPMYQSLLKDAGVKVLDYLPTNAWVVSLGRANAEKVAKLDFVRWFDEYQAAWKIDPEVGVRGFSSAERMQMQQFGRAALTVVFFDDAPQVEIDAAFGTIDNVAVFHSSVIGGNTTVSIEIDIANIDALAANQWVQYIEESSDISLRNDTNAWIVQSNVPGFTPLWDAGLHGEDQILGLLDGALDRNHCSFSDINPIGPTHRKIVAYNTSFGANTHGTHVGGTAVGDAGVNNATRGIAYLGKLAYNGIPSFNENAVKTALTTHHGQGARVHTNSWGDDGTTAYNSLCRGFDDFQWMNEDSFICLAVTNTSTLKNPENAKNMLSCGASEDTPNQGSHCTAGVGPTSDGRRKPELYAPGCNTQSAAANTSCGIAGLTGTSMATPAIAGTAMLVRQYYMEGYHVAGIPDPSSGFTPSAALIKATLLNSSVDMTGIAGFPSNLEGWGRVLADNALYFLGDTRKLDFVDVRNAQGLTTGGDVSSTINVIDNTEPLRVTLAWMEPAATSGAAQAWINDLNLEVVAPSGTVYKGNVFASGQSTTGGTADDRNNVEMVHVISPEVGEWTLRVSATAVNQGPQGYSLVSSGAIESGPVPLTVSITTSVPTIRLPNTPLDLNVLVKPGEDQLVNGSAKFFYRLDGGSYVESALTFVSGEMWSATVPGADCGQMPEFYVQAEGVNTGVRTAPFGAPANAYSYNIGEFVTNVAMSESFESGLPTGWTATGFWNVTSSCAPSSPCDGSSFAYYGQTGTCNFNNGSQNSGLLSRSIALPSVPSGGVLTLKYCSNLETEDNSSYDQARVRINGNDVDTPSETNQWETRSVDLTQFAGQTVTLGFNFDTIDSIQNDFRGWQIDNIVIEATNFECSACYADCDGSGALNVFDYICFGNAYAANDPYADCDGSGSLNVFDYICFGNAYAAGCP